MSKRDAQSLSICVPGVACINRCKYCVACMHTDTYKNQMDVNLPFYDLYLEDYIRRMVYAKENDANIMMITGDIEPLQNRPASFRTIVCKWFRFVEAVTSWCRPYSRAGLQ